MSTSSTVLQVIDLYKTFQAKGSPFSIGHDLLYAVNGVSFRIPRGHTLGLVGESGCGKTTAGRCIARLYEPNQGHVLVDPPDEVMAKLDPLITELDDLRDQGPVAEKDSREPAMTALRAKIRELAVPYDILSKKGKDLVAFRKRVQIVFQDPWASLNPQQTVRQILSEGPARFGIAEGKNAMKRYVSELLERVGLSDAALARYPHEFSGGQRQRIGVARALSVQPEVIICDEPVSALDVSIQAQILNLLQDLQQDMNLSYLFISHDLGVVRYLSDRVAVMYLGSIVEDAPSDDIFDTPRHPYTRSLLDSIPRLDGAMGELFGYVKGEPPSPVNIPKGCPFSPRCPKAEDRCTSHGPVWNREETRRTWCHFPEN